MIDKNEFEKKQHIELAYRNDKSQEDPNLLAKQDNYFQISNDEISSLMKCYLQKNKDEDLNLIAEFGGVEGFAKRLRTDISKGLDFSSPQDIKKRIEVFGENQMDEEKMKNCCQFVWEAFEDLMIRILCVAAIVQTILGATVGEDKSRDWVDGMSIIIAVCLVVSVGSITNYSKEKKFKQLKEEKESMVFTDVIRNGENITIKPSQILVGDLVHIKGGNTIPADGILVSSSFISVDESPMTGESDVIKKETYDVCLNIRDCVGNSKDQKKKTILSPIICSGTQVATGEGVFLAIAVGPRSQKGIIQVMVNQSKESEDSKTPLEEKLDTLAEQIGYFGMIAAGVTLVALFIRLGVSYPIQDEKFHVSNQTATLIQSYLNNDPSAVINSNTLNNLKNQATDPKTTVGSSVLHIILLVVAIIVVAIPEGLPLAVTLTLAFSIGKMMEQKNLVRNMQACETMGGANYICSDKTGTLTQNKMIVIHVFNGVDDINLEDVTTKSQNRVDPKEYFHNPRYYHDFKLAVLLNIDVSKNENGELGNFNKTDKSIFDLFVNLKEKIFNIRDKYLVEGYTKKIPFNSDRKRMTTIVKNDEFPTGYRLFIKGGPDVLMKSIVSYVNPQTNEIIKLSETDKNAIKEGTIKEYAKRRALRNMIICYKDITAEQYENYSVENEEGELIIEVENLIFLAIIGIRDALRPDVDQAVKKCQIAGITVVMVTGDHLDTAQAIARQCNIIEPNSTNLSLVAMEGKTFFEEIGGIICGVCSIEKEKCQCPKIKKNNDDIVARDEIKHMDKFELIVSDLRVLARSRPIDKYALVLGLRKLGNVVAVTGDGTNDAPALSKADVGFSMGKGGTDVAKEASDIMILDDNFSSIVNAVLWGRNIFDNIRKFIQFQLSVNIAACILVFITACIGNETPLTTIQMLWLNLIMDSLGSLALATEPPHEKLLYRKPYRRNEHIINRVMWKHILIQAFVKLGLLLFLYSYAPFFVEENEPYRITESMVIQKCYNSLPGRQPVFEGNEWIYYIINGSSTEWSSNIPLVNGMTEADCGDYAKCQDLSVAFKKYVSANGNSSHMTIVFNSFVIYTLFNQINARVIDDNYNIFFNINKNVLFIFVIFIEFILQILFIEFGSGALQVSRKGLSGLQWGICIGFGSITFVVSFLIKIVTKLIEKFTKKSELKVESAKLSLDSSNQKLEPYIQVEKKDSEKAVDSKRKESVIKQIVLSQSKLNRHGSLANSLRRSRKDL